MTHRSPSRARLAPLALVAAASALALSPAVARADRRYYGETYNQLTSPPAGLDVELWATLHQAPRSGGTQYWYYSLELETGITPRWDVALYNDLSYYQGGTTQYAATRLETRYRLSDYGEWFVDPVLYFEAKKEWIQDKPWGLEGKVIVAKDIGPLNLSVNGSYELEFPDGGGVEQEWAWAAGASYELVPAVRLGGEAFGYWTVPTEGGTVATVYAGPAVSVAWWRMWLLVAAGWGLNDASEQLRLRGVLAFQF